MPTMNDLLDWIGRRISAKVLTEDDRNGLPVHTSEERLRRVLRPGDVLLVDGRDKVSAAIRYLTQSSWSHVALYVGDIAGTADRNGKNHSLVEVNLGEGCVSSPLSKYQYYPTRICRPHSLTEADRRIVIQFMIDHIGIKYDVRNVIDLARYLIPHPPVPVRWRRKMLALGSGEPTRAICSTLIAQAFGRIRYPILPDVKKVQDGSALANGYTAEEIFHIRHHSLYTPRDFDVSPFFEIVKPTLVEGFNYKGVAWYSASRRNHQQLNLSGSFDGSNSSSLSGFGANAAVRVPFFRRPRPATLVSKLAQPRRYRSAWVTEPIDADIASASVQPAPFLQPAVVSRDRSKSRSLRLRSQVVRLSL